MFVLIEYVRKPPQYASAGVSSGKIGLTFVPNLNLHSYYVYAVKALPSLVISTASPDLLLLHNGISTKVSCAGS